MTPEQVSPAFRSHCDYARDCDPARYEYLGTYFIRRTVEPHAAVDVALGLVEVLVGGSHATVLRWLANHYPEHLKLVPPDQHAAFLKGVYGCLDRLERVALKKVLISASGTPAAKKSAARRPAPRSVLHLLAPSRN